MKWCEEKSWKDYDHSESSFLYSKWGFVKNQYRGMDYIKQTIIPYLGGGECVVNREVIYQKHPKLELIKNSKVLLIGGGPTTNECKWDASQYDYVISCNHFFKNKSLGAVPLFMVFLGDETNLKDSDLKEYLNKNETLIGFENICRDRNELSEFKTIWGDRVFWAHTRYHSKIGSIPRIASFVCGLEPKEISFVGMDGFVPQSLLKEHKLSFQSEKTQTGTIERNKDEDIIVKKYKQQYLEFWDYLLHDIGQNVSFKNLGHQHPCNLTTQILTEQVGKNYTAYLSDPKTRSI